ncbi:hypothetical protein HNR56_002929 [Roseospira marina]|nr:hypothetical protein [Roseospira marina]MBB5088224.1 hypothetical protein [Roseospira marina]
MPRLSMRFPTSRARRYAPTATSGPPQRRRSDAWRRWTVASGVAKPALFVAQIIPGTAPGSERIPGPGPHNDAPAVAAEAVAPNREPPAAPNPVTLHAYDRPPLHVGDEQGGSSIPPLTDGKAN